MHHAQTPKEIGAYRLVQKIGEGGFARIFLALRNTSPCILKILKPERIQSSPSSVEHFIREVQVGTLLNHPNLLHFTDQGEVNGFYFGVMPYRVALPLHRLLESYRIAGRWIPLDLALYIVREVAKGLAFLHQKTVFKHSASMLFHGDLSSDNILLSESGEVTIGDFGSSRQETSSDEASVHYGKISYLPSEILEGQPVSRQTDIYSLGILAFYLLEGDKPFRANTPKDMVQAQKTVRPKLKQNATLSEKDRVNLQIFFNQALNSNPELRFQDVQDFAEQFFSIRFKERPATTPSLAAATYDPEFKSGLRKLKNQWEEKIQETLQPKKDFSPKSKEAPGERPKNLLVRQEVRKYPRLRTEGKGLRAEVISPYEKYKSEFEIHEIGRGGCLMKWQALEPKRGQTYPIFMRLREDGAPIKIVGKLCYEVRRKGRTYVGFQFTRISDAAANEIAAYVADNLKTSDMSSIAKADIEETIVEVFFESTSDWEKEFRENIAHGGLFVKASQTFERDQKIKIKIRLPDSDRQLILQGTVATCSPLEDAKATHGIGVQLDLSPEKIRALQNLAEND